MAKRKRSEPERLPDEFPDEPWKLRKEWDDGLVKGSARFQATVLAVLSVIFLGASIPAILAIPEEWKKGNYAILLVLIFAVAGLVMAKVAIDWLRQFWRFGALSLALDPMPGSWGGWVGGVVRIPKGVWIQGDTKLRLKCSRMVVSGAGKNRRRRETILWETDQTLPVARLGGMGLIREIPVKILVEKGNGEPSDAVRDRDFVEWTLLIEIPARGTRRPLKMDFPVPVFDRGENLKEDSALSHSAQRDRKNEQGSALAEAGGSRQLIAGEEVWSFHQPSAKRQTLGLFLFAVLFGSVAWWVEFLPIRLAFGGFALLLGLLIPGILWHRSELRIGQREVVVRRRSWRGWKAYRIPADEIAKLELSESLRSGQNRYMRLIAVGVEGVDPEKPHPAEHFKARKARFRYQREARNGGDPSDATTMAILETPCFEIELAGYLLGTRAAQDVKKLLEVRLGLSSG